MSRCLEGFARLIPKNSMEFLTSSSSKLSDLRHEEVARVSEIFPEIDLIKDGELKEKVAKVIQKGLQSGGWESIEKVSYIDSWEGQGHQSITLIEYTREVTQIAIGSAKVLGRNHIVDMDYIIAAGLLHDMGLLLEFEKKGGGGERG